MALRQLKVALVEFDQDPVPNCRVSVRQIGTGPASVGVVIPTNRAEVWTDAGGEAVFMLAPSVPDTAYQVKVYSPTGNKVLDQSVVMPDRDVTLAELIALTVTPGVAGGLDLSAVNAAIMLQVSPVVERVGALETLGPLGEAQVNALIDTRIAALGPTGGLPAWDLAANTTVVPGESVEFATTDAGTTVSAPDGEGWQAVTADGSGDMVPWGSFTVAHSGRHAVKFKLQDNTSHPEIMGGTYVLLADAVAPAAAYINALLSNSAMPGAVAVAMFQKTGSDLTVNAIANGGPLPGMPLTLNGVALNDTVHVGYAADTGALVVAVNAGAPTTVGTITVPETVTSLHVIMFTLINGAATAGACTFSSQGAFADFTNFGGPTTSLHLPAPASVGDVLKVDGNGTYRGHALQDGDLVKVLADGNIDPAVTEADLAQYPTMTAVNAAIATAMAGVSSGGTVSNHPNGSDGVGLVTTVNDQTVIKTLKTQGAVSIVDDGVSLTVHVDPSAWADGGDLIGETPATAQTLFSRNGRNVTLRKLAAAAGIILTDDVENGVIRIGSNAEATAVMQGFRGSDGAQTTSGLFAGKVGIFFPSNNGPQTLQIDAPATESNALGKNIPDGTAFFLVGGGNTNLSLVGEDGVFVNGHGNVLSLRQYEFGLLYKHQANGWTFFNVSRLSAGQRVRRIISNYTQSDWPTTGNWLANDQETDLFEFNVYNEAQTLPLPSYSAIAARDEIRLRNSSGYAITLDPQGVTTHEKNNNLVIAPWEQIRLTTDSYGWLIVR